MQRRLEDKYRRLEELLRSMESVAIAFSGGVDSTLLAKVAHDVLGQNMIAVTAHIRAMPTREFDEAVAWCAQEGIEHVVCPYDELTIPGYSQNPPDRCYLCKREVFGRLIQAARKRCVLHVVDGSNVDDEGDYRPGMRALEELGIRSPLRECDLSKDDVRTLSHELGLPTWNMPSSACLASRIAYGEAITAQKLQRIEDAEKFLREAGFGQLRVRMHGAQGELARIEVPANDITRLAAEDVRAQLATHLHELGFAYVCLDLDGFRSGAMNEILA